MPRSRPPPPSLLLDPSLRIALTLISGDPPLSQTPAPHCLVDPPPFPPPLPSPPSPPFTLSPPPSLSFPDPLPPLSSAQWIDVKKYEAELPDDIVSQDMFTTLESLNRAFSEPLKELLSGIEASEGGGEVDDCMIISIDKLGCEVRVRRRQAITVDRLGFDSNVKTLQDAEREMERITRDRTSLVSHRVR